MSISRSRNLVPNIYIVTWREVEGHCRFVFVCVSVSWIMSSKFLLPLLNWWKSVITKSLSSIFLRFSKWALETKELLLKCTFWYRQVPCVFNEEWLIWHACRAGHCNWIRKQSSYNSISMTQWPLKLQFQHNKTPKAKSLKLHSHVNTVPPKTDRQMQSVCLMCLCCRDK